MAPIPDTFQPGKPQWQRKLLWWIRNPFPEFTHNVLGITKRKFTTDGPYGAVTWNPNGGGWNWLVHTLQTDSPFDKRFFVSYRGTTYEWYLGWRPNGAFGMAFRKAKSGGY